MLTGEYVLPKQIFALTKKIPNNETFCFLRVQNISDSIITLSKDFAIAQVMFEELKEVPNQTYNKQNPSFQNETEFIGVGKYQPEYEKLSKAFSDTKEDMETLKDKMYANILTIMGIFVSIFTIVSVNIQSFSINEISTHLIATVNLSLISCISVLMGFILLIIHKGKTKCFRICYTVMILALLIITAIFALR